jgi:GLPGLI family protein
MKQLIKLIAIAFIFSSTLASAQTKLTSGTITYTIDVKADSADEQQTAMAAMMPKELAVNFKDGALHMEMDLQILKMKMLKRKADEYIVLMDMNGSKMGFKGTQSELTAFVSKGSKEPDVNFTATGEKKKILGYACVKYTGKTTKDGKAVTLAAWVCNDIVCPNEFTTPNYKGFTGTVMEFSSVSGGLESKYIVNKIDKTVPDASLFEVPEGYELQSFKEAMKSMGK